MNEGYYIKPNGEKVYFDPESTTYLDGIPMTKLVVPDGVIFLSCEFNGLKELILPEGILSVSCNNNNLTQLILPDSVEYAWCDNNQLTELIVPNNIFFLTCYHNKIKNVKLPTNKLITIWPDLNSIDLVELKNNKPKTPIMIYA